MSELPLQLFEDCPNDDERGARIGRFLVLEELGFFKRNTNIDLAMKKGQGSWTAQVRKRFSGRFGDVRGCEPADIEVAAELLGQFDAIYNMEWAADEP